MRTEAGRRRPYLQRNYKNIKPRLKAWFYRLGRYSIYFFPPLPAFFASISAFASNRFGDLYGRLEVFFFGLNAIIRVMVSSI